MSPPIQDGTYRIRNIKYPNVVDLSGGLPWAGINGWAASVSSPNLEWKIQNVGNDQVTIESVPASGFYANVPIFLKAVPLAVSPSPTLWSIVSTGAGNYRISTFSGGTEYFWFLLGSANGVTIYLETGKDGDDAHWEFDPVTNN